MKLAEIHDDVFMCNIMVFAGHGGFCRVYRNRPRMITVPSNTTITFWCPDQSGQFSSLSTLDNDIGKLIDVTNGLSEMCKTMRASNDRLPVTYEAGDQIKNYVLMSPQSLQLGEARSLSRLVTVQQSGIGSTKGVFLEDLLYEFSGRNCHWAACREVINLSDVIMEGGELVRN
ncbi:MULTISPECIES: putative adhesin [Pseudomonas]|jgi:hypothetical protein|uniref:putative adhesin n=1 Tax=Pseudomonas TaxID=286 RepID=UPI000DA95C36|nr:MULTISPECIES: hypothetical protein [Pseudomonas]MDW3711807.1 hypothetical protein [Pseudomonas sp. 2023EL-01195]PZE13969.1 hypothetical protein DMX10_08125 [Pseudomonas sp. 57B-090624]UXY54359.1 hypothetical protein N9L84_07205 [Pseudomonas tohonis]BBP81801.1 hypothetical protein PHLH8_14430 [Pseudomonas sp. Pc102]